MNAHMLPFPLSQRRNFRGILVAFIGAVAICMLWRASFRSVSPAAIGVPQNPRPTSISKAFVVASRAKDDISWVRKHLSGWDVKRFIVDSSFAQYTVPENKGREAMVYLTYIIDAYDKLPDVTVFMHSSRYQWHNDDPLYDGVPLLQNLQLPYIISQGYANLRCVWTLGCPSELKLDQQGNSDPEAEQSTQSTYPQAFKELFPGEQVPDVVGVACCAQFAVTRDKILERPIEDYKRYRQWLLDTPLDDDISGRILEYSWHIIFGKPHVYCPNAKQCYCNTFGLCNLDCDGEDKCGERWPFPPYSTLPQGWPTVGWDGKSRDQGVLANLRQVAMSSENQSA